MADSRDEPASTDAAPTRVRHSVLAWACSLSFITYLDRVCIKETQPQMTADLGLTKDEFGLVFSAFSIAYALFEIPTGLMGDRLGARKVLFRIVLWWSVFTALTGLVWPFAWTIGPITITALWALIAIRFLFGMGEAGAYPNLALGLRRWIPYRRRGMSQGIVWMAARWGGALAPPLILVFRESLGWRGSFLAFGVIGAVWGYLFWRNFRDDPSEDPRVNAAELALIREGAASSAEPKLPISWSDAAQSPTLWFLCVMYFCSNAGWYFFITWDKEYFRTVLAFEDGSWPLAIATGAPLFFGGIACLLGGLTTDRMVRVLGRRWGRTTQGIVGYLLGGLCFFLALWAQHPVWSVVFLCLASFVKDFGMGASWATCVDIGHKYSGTISGWMNMIGNLGGATSALVVARLAGREGGAWDVALQVSGISFLIAGVCWAFIDPRRIIVYRPEDLKRLS